MTTTPKELEDIAVSSEDEPTTPDEPDVDVADLPVDDGGDDTGEPESAEAASDPHDAAEAPSEAKRGPNWSRILVYGVLPALALLLAVGSGFLKWQDSTTRVDDAVQIQALQVAKDSTIALLSYQPNTVEQQLGAARDLLTGEFRDAYTKLTNEVVIPGAKQQQISAVATVSAAAPVSVSEKQAVVLVFVNQTTVIGNGAPSDTTSAVRVTLDRVDGRWLISQFDPV